MLVGRHEPLPRRGHFGDPKRSCTCTATQIYRYRSRISGPLLDRIDIHIEVPPVTIAELSRERPEEPSAAIRERVSKARAIQLDRFNGRNIHANAQIIRPGDTQTLSLEH